MLSNLGSRLTIKPTLASALSNHCPLRWRSRRAAIVGGAMRTAGILLATQGSPNTEGGSGTAWLV